MTRTVRVTATDSAEVSKSAPRPDLQTQLEDLLNQVWMSEKEWRLDDRISLSQRLGHGPRPRS